MPSETFYPIVNGDDGCVNWGSFANNQAFLSIGNSGGQRAETFVRFCNVAIPQGANITSAFVRFIAYQSQSITVCNVKCHINNHDNASAPIDLSEFDALVLTAGIVWNNLSSWTDNSSYDTPDIASDVQSIINRAGWSSGNAMMAVVKNNGSSSNAVRYIASMEHSGAEKAELHVTWEEDIETAYYISGYVKEGIIPVNRQIYLHNRDTGALITSTTSSGVGGYFYMETTYSGSHYVVCLDDEIGADYNDLIYGKIFPVTISG